MIDIQKIQRISPWNPAYALESTDTALEPFLTFTDKDGYLVWRSEWKAVYKDLSSRIREMRTTWRAEGSTHEPLLHNSLFGARAAARTMLAIRKASKVRAEALYQQAKAAAEAVA